MIQHSCSARVQWPRLADFRITTTNYDPVKVDSWSISQETYWPPRNMDWRSVDDEPFRCVAALILWNSAGCIRQARSINNYKSLLKTHLFKQAFNVWILQFFNLFVWILRLYYCFIFISWVFKNRAKSIFVKRHWTIWYWYYYYDIMLDNRISELFVTVSLVLHK